MNDPVVLLRRMDESLGGNAAYIKAGSAGLSLLDDDRIESELSGANGAHISARSGSDHEELAGDVLHLLQTSTKIIAGASSSVLMRCTKTAASQPSMIRGWKLGDRLIIF